MAAAQDALEAAVAADLLPAGARGTGYGALSAVNGVGDLFSSLTLGALWTLGSPHLGFTVSAGLAASGTLLMARFAWTSR